MRGTIVVNEVVFQLRDIVLVDRRVMLIAVAVGPQPPYPGGVTDIELFGKDGSACGSVRTMVPSWHEVHKGNTVTIELPIILAEIIGHE